MNKMKKDYSSIRGYIPTELTIVSRPEQDILVDEKTIKARPAYIVDSANEKTKESAICWAKGNYWEKITEEPKIETHTNDILFGVRISDLEIRSEGGRAYKVLIPTYTTGYYYVDLREDVLLDTMFKHGICKQGILLGEYIWAMVGGQMKLILCNSKLHERLIETTEIRKIDKKITSSEWKPGCVYVGKNNEPKLFLGWIDTIEFDIQRETYNSSKKYLSKYVKNKALWYDFYNINIPENAIKILYDNFKKGQFPCWIYNPKNFVVKIKEFELPNTFWEDYHKYALARAEDYKEKLNGNLDFILHTIFLRPTGMPIMDIPDWIKNEVRKYGIDMDEW